MPLNTSNLSLIPKNMERKELQNLTPEARAEDVRTWKNLLFHSKEMRQTLFGDPFADRFAFDGAAYVMNNDGKLSLANTLWDEPDRYHEAVMSDRLFVRDSAGKMRQVQMSDNNGGNMYLSLSSPLTNMNAVQAPVPPTTFEYIFFLFFWGKIQAYNRQKEAYDAMQSAEAQETFRSAIRSAPLTQAQEEARQENNLMNERLENEIDRMLQQNEIIQNRIRELDQQNQPQAAPDPNSVVQQPEPNVVVPPDPNVVQQPNEQVVEQPPQQEVEQPPRPVEEQIVNQPEGQKIDAPPVQQNAPVNEGEAAENIKQDDNITRTLQPYFKDGLEKAFAKIAYGKDVVEKNVPKDCPVKLDGLALGVLSLLALGDKDMSIPVGSHENRMYNNPDTYYPEVVGGNRFLGKPMGKTATAFSRKAMQTAGASLRTLLNSGDYTPMAKIIARGLTQNNKMLQGFKQLNDSYTAYAMLGAKALEIMESNEQLKNAVMAELGNDPKQINMAKAAKNISDLRVSVMENFDNLVAGYNMYTTRKKPDGSESKVPAVPGKESDVTKVALLCHIDVDMNFGQFDLATCKLENPNAIPKRLQRIEATAVINSFMGADNRGDLMKNSVAMKGIYTGAKEEMDNYVAMRKQMKEQGIEIENNEPKGPEIVFG